MSRKKYREPQELELDDRFVWNSQIHTVQELRPDGEKHLLVRTDHHGFRFSLDSPSLRLTSRVPRYTKRADKT